jgi:hypothetical protein
MLMLSKTGSGRHSHNCIACDSSNLKREWSVVSPFFALRALLSGPQIVSILTCSDCKTRYFDRVITDQELSRLYDDYRGAEYFQQRNRFEPSYTAEFNASLGGDAGMSERRAILAEVMLECPEMQACQKVLDHGGDRGQMLKDLNVERKAVYDISGVDADQGVEAVSLEQVKAGTWDLILSCHVLEHLTFPGSYVEDLVSLGHNGTYYFVEVPHEPARSHFFNRTIFQRLWLMLLIKSPKYLQKFDLLSGSVLWRKGIILPLLFFPLREHLTFFTVEGVKALLRRKGLLIVSAKQRATGHIVVVAKKIS